MTLKQHAEEIAVVILIAGLMVTYMAWQNGLMLGARWLDWTANNPGAGDPWTLAPHVVLPACYAYQYAGMGCVFAGGFAGGAGIAVFSRKRDIFKVFTCVFTSVGFTALGFNTMDWMAAEIIASVAEWHNAWYFYFFGVVAPLWLGGALIGAAVVAFMKY